MSELSASILLTLRDEVSQRARAISARIKELEKQIEQGGDVGAAAAVELRQEFEALTQTTRESEAITRRFNQAQRSLATGTDGTAAATRGMAGAQQRAGSAISFVSKESKNQGREIGGLVNVFAELGYSVGAAVPGMQQTGTQLAIMGGTAYQLGAAFGVAGAAVGVLSGLLPTLISALSGASREARNLKQDLDESIETYETLMSKIQRRYRFEEEQRALAAGEKDVVQQRAHAEAARTNRAEVRAQMAARAGRVGLGAGLTSDEMAYVRRAVVDDYSSTPQDIAVGGRAILRDRIRSTLSESERQLPEDRVNELVDQRVRLRESMLAASAATIQTDPIFSAAARALRVHDTSVDTAESGLQIATRRDAERRARETRSETVDLSLQGANADHAAAQRALLGLAADAGLHRSGRLAVERDIRSGELSERSARRIGGDQGVAYLEALRRSAQEQERLGAERARIESEARARRLRELEATERAAGAMERAADAMERASVVSGPAQLRQAVGISELGGAS